MRFSGHNKSMEIGSFQFGEQISENWAISSSRSWKRRHSFRGCSAEGLFENKKIRLKPFEGATVYGHQLEGINAFARALVGRENPLNENGGPFIVGALRMDAQLLKD